MEAGSEVCLHLGDAAIQAAEAVVNPAPASIMEGFKRIKTTSVVRADALFTGHISVKSSRLAENKTKPKKRTGAVSSGSERRILVWMQKGFGLRRVDVEEKERERGVFCGLIKAASAAARSLAASL